MFCIAFKTSMNVMATHAQMEAHALIEWLPSRVLVLTDMKETLVRQVTTELLHRQTGPNCTCMLKWHSLQFDYLCTLVASSQVLAQAHHIKRNKLVTSPHKPSQACPKDSGFSYCSY